MATVAIHNNVSSNIAFEARILTLQGQHLTVRASLIGGRTTNVPLPQGVTIEMLAESPEVKAEAQKASPNYTIVGNADLSVVGGLADYEILRAQQSPPVDATIQLGSVQRAGKLTRVRFIAPVPTAAGESYAITEILKNGTNIKPVTLTLVHPASRAAYVETDIDVSHSNLVFADGDFIAITVDYTAGGGSTLTSIVTELRFSQS